MKTKKMMMAVVAIFISMTVMTAQAPVKKTTKAEPAKKECCEKKTAECCKDNKKKSECCKDAAKKGENKSKTAKKETKTKK